MRQKKTAKKKISRPGRTKPSASQARRGSAEESRSGRSPDEFAGMYRPIKKPITVRVDADVLAWFKKQGKGYQTRINAALRKMMIEDSTS